ncbi:GPW/gp25 family protein [Micromonospora sp. WMMD1082]|uniref:GPW/gp25 family protein n=1 Tax=Micromonospora sp. WMMD1082 TaxID=3016104 RepID=UPI0024174AA1|nr:GPW/gp25 family protein [Micromonospora sp. WMMD1082]MDG4797226.1 GPW/gp25 family protein [Micromonospora sp. WMMD1082]
MRAIRFVGAGFDPSRGSGLGLTAAGGLAMTDGDETVRQALFLLLSTTPGERLMRPGYGSRLHRLVFAPNDDTTAGLAIHYVRAAIARWEPRIDVLDVDAGPDPDDPWRLVIRLDYRIRASLTPGQLVFSVDLLPADDEPPAGPMPDPGADAEEAR